MRELAACTFQSESVASDWELGGRGSPIFLVALAALKYPEHRVGGGVIVEKLQMLALKEI